MTAPDTDQLSVVFLPDFRDGNPYQSNLSAALDDRGVTVRFGQTGGLFPIWRSIRDVGDVDVLHVHWLSPYIQGDSHLRTLVKSILTVLQLVILHVSGVVVVWTVHNLTPHDAPYPRVGDWTTRHIVRQCDQFFVHCGVVGDELDERFGDGRVRERTRVVPHGHYLDNYENDVSRAVAREQLSLDPGCTVFLCFGRVRPYKGLRELITTFSAAAAPESRLLIVGAPERDTVARELRQAANGDERIQTEFRFVPNDQVQVFMNAADVVVLPYRNIATSGSAVLAMSFGRAVISPDAGCMPEMIGTNGGFLYEAEDPDGLRSAIRAAERSDLTAIGEHNRRVVGDFDWDDIAERTTEGYLACR